MKKIIGIFLLSLLVISSCSSNKNIKLAKGLSVYYPLNGNVNDVKNKTNLIFNNATLTTDRFGKANSAYHFNGIDNYIQIQNNPAINFKKSISICIWARPTGFYYGTCHSNRILMKGESDYTPGNYTIAFDEALYSPGTACSSPLTDTIHQNFRSVADQNSYTPYITKGKWTSIIFTCDQHISRLYIDGLLKDSLKLTDGVTFTNQSDLFFGKLNNDSFPYWYNGDLDDVRIYNRIINPLEIKKIAEVR
jgi:hypothetical protein